jgi:AcrR family transcriptional regulator
VDATDTRARNPRGEGARLRDDIVAAAMEILEEAGTTEAVTLRAVARRVGISAPSIYGHFPDREAVVQVVLADGFRALTAALRSAIAAGDDPVGRLRLGCAAYLRFGEERPALYQAMFGCRESVQPGHVPTALQAGVEAFGVLVEWIRDAAAQGYSTSADPYADATALWVALHGMCTLTANLPGFPWPDHGVVFETLVARLARLG